MVNGWRGPRAPFDRTQLVTAVLQGGLPGVGGTRHDAHARRLVRELRRDHPAA